MHRVLSGELNALIMNRTYNHLRSDTVPRWPKTAICLNVPNKNMYTYMKLNKSFRRCRTASDCKQSIGRMILFIFISRSGK